MMGWVPKYADISTDSRHKSYLLECYIHANKFSDDESTKNGALLVNRYGKVISKGTNHFMSGLEKKPERLKRPAKYQYITHAEADVIFNAAKQGIATQGLKMYMPWLPCLPCARTMIEAGISSLVAHQGMVMKTPERWHDSLDDALEILHETGVEVTIYDGKIGNIGNLFNGKIWKP